MRTEVEDAAREDTARRPGRPRSERAEQAILDATLEAFAERGVEGVRLEDVAARAGVGKATLYRRWPGKEELLIAALAARLACVPYAAMASTGTRAKSAAAPARRAGSPCAIRYSNAMVWPSMYPRSRSDWRK